MLPRRGKSSPPSVSLWRCFSPGIRSQHFTEQNGGMGGCGRTPTCARWMVVVGSVDRDEENAGLQQVTGAEADHRCTFDHRSSRKSDFNETQA